MYKDFLYENKEDGTPFEMIERDIDLHGDEFWQSMDDFEFELHYGIQKKDFIFSYSAEYSLYTKEKLDYSRIDTIPFTESSLEKMMEDFRGETFKYLSAPKITGSNKAQKIRNSTKIAPPTSARPSEAKKKAKEKISDTGDKLKKKARTKSIPESIDSIRSRSPESKLKKEFNQYIKNLLRQKKSSLAKRRINLKYKALKALMTKSGTKWGSPEWYALVKKFFPESNFASTLTEGSVEEGVNNNDSLLLKKENSTKPTKKESEIIPDGEATDLSDQLKSKVADKTGTKIDNVEAFKNDNSASEIGAKAYTKDNNIHFAPGHFKPKEKDGQKLIAHELAHVGQQKNGIVNNGSIQKMDEDEEVNTSSLEIEADEIANEVVDGPLTDTEETDDNNESSNKLESNPDDLADKIGDDTTPKNNDEEKNNSEDVNDGEIKDKTESDESENSQETDELEVKDKESIAEDAKNELPDGDDTTTPNTDSIGGKTETANTPQTEAINTQPSPQITAENGNQTTETTDITSQSVERESKEFIEFKANFQKKKDKVINDAQQTKEKIKASAEQQKQHLESSLLKEDEGIEKAYNTKIKSLKKGLKRLKVKIKGQKKLKLEKAKQNYENEVSLQDQLYETKCQGIDSKVNEVADNLSRNTDEQANNVTKHGDSKSQEAKGIAENIAKSYSSERRSKEIRDALIKTGCKVADSILKGAKKTANKIKREAKKAAKEIRKSAKGSKKQLKKQLKNSKKELKKTHKSIRKNITDLAEISIKEISLEIDKNINAFEAKRDGDNGKFARFAALVCNDIDKRINIAIENIDGQVATTASQLDEYFLQAQEKFATESGEKGKSTFKNLLIDVDNALTPVNQFLANYSNAVTNSIEAGTTKNSSMVQADANNVKGMEGDNGNVDSGLDVAVQNLIAEFDKILNEGQEQFSSVTQGLEKNYTKTINDFILENSKSANKTFIKLKSIASDNISQMNTAINSLPDKLDEKAKEIINKKLWQTSAFWKGFGQGLKNFITSLPAALKELGKLISENILDTVLIIAAIVAVIAILIFFGIAGVALLIVGIFFSAIFIGITIHKLATQWDNLSDEEIGECFGEMTFEVVTIVFSALKIAKIKNAAKLIKAANATKKTGNIAKTANSFEKISKMARNSRQSTRIIKAAGKAKSLEKLLKLTKDNVDLLDDLLKSTKNGDDLIAVIKFSKKAANVEKTLEKVGLTGTELAKLLKTGKVKSIIQLEKISRHSKIDNVNQIYSLLKNPKLKTTRKLIGLLNDKKIKNADQLNKLLQSDIFETADKLKQLLKHSGITNADDIEKVLGKAKDLKDLKSILGIGEGIQLHHITPKYLGGAANGAMIPLDAAYHQLITNAFRNAWKYGQENPSAAQLKQIMDDVYTQFPLPPGYTY